MADPVTLSLIATGLAVAGTVGSTVSAMGQAKSAENAADYNAQVAEQNARITRQQSSAAEEIQRRRAREGLSQQKAGVTESGLSLSGSALDLYTDAIAETELDIMTQRYQGELRAAGLQSEADQQRSAASGYRTAGRTALVTGILGAGTELAGGLSYANRLKTGGGMRAPTDRNGFGPGGR